MGNNTEGFTNLQELHVYWMKQALRLAEKASQEGEVPVGAVLVKSRKLLALASNAIVKQGDPTAHAEILVLREAVKQTHHHYLDGTTLYVTLEPCLMCLGAIMQLHVPQVIFGAYDPKRGAIGSTLDILQLKGIAWHPDIWGGLCEAESCQLLRNFFRQQRSKIFPALV